MRLDLKDPLNKLAQECWEKKVTFMFGSKEEWYNNAVALKE